jgi:hypothetical protein
MIRHTFNISIVNLPVPEAMACDGDVFADSTGVEELGAEQLVAEESGLITGDHGPCWVGEAAGRDESGKGSDDGEDGSEEVHLDSGDGVWVGGIRVIFLSLEEEEAILKKAVYWLIHLWKG